MTVTRNGSVTTGRRVRARTVRRLTGSSFARGFGGTPPGSSAGLADGGATGWTALGSRLRVRLRVGSSASFGVPDEGEGVRGEVPDDPVRPGRTRVRVRVRASSSSGLSSDAGGASGGVRA
ncbi:MAG: hypothetical protein ACRDYA_00600 [Egibacteraceae bacterium]